MEFDRSGRLRDPEAMAGPFPFTTNNGESLIPRADPLPTIQLKRLSRLNKFWHGLGPDVRFHTKALVGCVLCFSSIFFPSLYCDDRFELVDSRAHLDDLLKDKSLFLAHQRRKFDYYFQPARDFQS